MKTKYPTKLLTNLVETEFLRNGAGDLSPKYDQIARKWQDLTDSSLYDSLQFVYAAMEKTVPEQLKSRGWSCLQKVSATFYEQDEPGVDDDYRLATRCVAGPGRTAVGLHIHVNGEDCWLWEIGRDMARRKKAGIDRASRRNIAQVVEDGTQPEATILRLIEGETTTARKSIKEWREIAG